ncbi:Myb-like DNA-binding domain containing protein [Tritrichomonas foetus]|uniref:Myb-like DNA-binding domain containing protein n=1 Tax=Tritrichomonas foetus TaxID=1144522 RepID=A0A1J4JGQ6_9EUKA|nr:Myb-like DNA-binding domain containing protein [Tritrichomonas foetus]|eukprot:OHS96420.1 Myb-like DNA-binding domain containing protein [Tritrichomonas foetus]
MQRSKRRTFTDLEDQSIREGILIYGENWDAIATKLPGRTPKQCHDRYVNYLRIGLKSDPWTPDEDEILIQLHNEIGSKWSKMMNDLPGRSGNDIKNRWHKHLIKRSHKTTLLDSEWDNRQHTSPTINMHQQHYSLPMHQMNYQYSLNNSTPCQNNVKYPKVELNLCAEIGWSDSELLEILEELNMKQVVDPLFSESMIIF